MIDYWKLTKDFAQGDVVQKINATTGDLSPYVGTVTAVFNGLGVLDVQWPFGNERVFPDDVVKVSPKFIRYTPPSFDQSYKTIEIEQARKIASAGNIWKHTKLPATLYINLAKSWHKGASEVVAYDDLYRKFGNTIADTDLRSETAKFYKLSSSAGSCRIIAHIQKNAAYWVAQDRQYRATSQDIKVGKPSCPKCAVSMRRATYRMHKGEKHKIFACPKCLCLIDPASILGPGGEAHNWFPLKVGV